MHGSALYAGGYFTTIGGQNRMGFAAFRDADVISPTVQVLSPNGGETLIIGEPRTFTWSASDNIGVQSVDLNLSRTGPSGPWELLAAGAANTGSYSWKATGPSSIGTSYLRVDVRDFDGNLTSDLSDAAFAIIEAPTAVTPPGTITAFALSPLAPNPAAGRVRVSFATPVRTQVRLALTDVQGREVAVLADGLREPGRYAAAFDAGGLHPGIYFVRLQGPGVVLTRRLAVVR
jgi:hypothetical protein